MTARPEPANPRYANITEADARVAQTAIDAWTEELTHQDVSNASPRYLLILRGILAGQFADVRWAGYVEGVAEGRRALARALLEHLESEGL